MLQAMGKRSTILISRRESFQEISKINVYLFLDTELYFPSIRLLLLDFISNSVIIKNAQSSFFFFSFLEMNVHIHIYWFAVFLFWSFAGALQHIFNV